MNKRTAPGADGLNPNFFRLFYLELSPILCKVHNSAFDYNSLPPSQTLSIIKLLPKKENSEQLKDFRLINLLNTDVKILSHILTSRVKTVLDKIIISAQFAYLPNRSIHSALPAIRKRINLLNRSRCVVNIDFSKAYDKIDREYLYDLLKRLNLDEITLKGIQLMYKANTALIEINGQLSIPLEINRGVKQGCPLSDLLFILGLEPLLQSIEECPQIRNYEGSKTIG